MKAAFFAETAGGKITGGALELLAWCRTLTAPEEITAILITPSVGEPELERLACSGAGTVVVYEDGRLDRADTALYAELLKSFCEAEKPDVLLGGATLFGRTLFPYAAMLMKTGLTADCTQLEIEPESGLLLQTRPAIGGNVTAVIKTPRHRPQMATVRPHSIPQAQPVGKTGALIRRLAVPDSLFTAEAPKTTSSVKLPAGEELAGAKRIVAVGRGIRRKENIRLAQTLASRIGAAVGATREVVDRGWLPYSAQIGLSGKTVVPDIYIALGISGAVQHLAGMRTAKKIVAVNTDPEAPIFQAADLGIVGDLFEVVPRLIDGFSQKTR